MVRRTAQDATPELVHKGLQAITKNLHAFRHKDALPISRLDLRVIEENPYYFYDTDLTADGSALYFRGKPLYVEGDLNDFLARRCSRQLRRSWKKLSVMKGDAS